MVDQPVSVYVGVLNLVAPFDMTYNEMAVMLPVLFGETPGIYVPYMYLDSPGAIVAGREIYGFPKKEAEIDLRKEAAAVFAVVSRNGSLLMKANAQLGPRVESIPQTPPQPWFGLKIIPSVKRGAPPDVQPLTSTLIGPRVVESRQGPATLEFGGGSADPLSDNPVVEVVGGILVLHRKT